MGHLLPAHLRRIQPHQVNDAHVVAQDILQPLRLAGGGLQALVQARQDQRLWMQPVDGTHLLDLLDAVLGQNGLRWRKRYALPADTKLADGELQSWTWE